MEITYDPAKDKTNLAKHAISLREATRFEWKTASITPDRREDYGEERYVATGYLGGRLYILVFTEREETLRVISLRKANKKEQKNYGKK